MSSNASNGALSGFINQMNSPFQGLGLPNTPPYDKNQHFGLKTNSPGALMYYQQQQQ